FGQGNDAEWAEHLEWTLALGGIGAFLFGTGLAYWMYVAQKGKPAARLAAEFPGAHQLLLDKTVIDGILARLTALIVAASGTILRAFQNGVVHMYAAMMVVGIAGMAWFFAVPHANATVVDAGNDDYVVSAAPGVGYGYRWDADGDGLPDQPDFAEASSVKLHLEPGKGPITVGLEVRNAFGLVKRKSISVARPQAPISSL